MKLARICLLLIAVIPLLRGEPIAAQDARLQPAQKSVEAWLALTDATRYAESRRQASAAFQAAVTEESWSHDMQTVRRWPLGKVQTRAFRDAVSAKMQPGLPEGDYVVVTYDTSFEHKQAAVETVTTSLEKDGAWRVAAYVIK